jgi:DNA-binding transcriptional LysR family regulator
MEIPITRRPIGERFAPDGLNLSIRQLRAFMALAELCNFTRAARKMHLSQPAFSALIRSLEETLSARLFDRDTRRVALTAAGLRFHRATGEVLANFDQIMNGFYRDLDQVRRVRIAAMPSLCARLLPPVVADFRLRHPAVDIDIVDALPSHCVDMVREGTVDIALSTTGRMDNDLHAELLCMDRFFAVCRRDHSLAGQSVIALETVVKHPFIHFTRQTRLRQQIDAALRLCRPNTVLEVERLDAVRGLVESGVGVSVVPGLTLFHFPGEQIAIRRLEKPGITREVFLLRARQHENIEYMHELVHAIRRQMRFLMREIDDRLTVPAADAIAEPLRIE